MLGNKPPLVQGTKKEEKLQSKGQAELSLEGSVASLNFHAGHTGGSTSGFWSSSLRLASEERLLKGLLT